MGRVLRGLRVFLASPGDVAAERQCVKNVVEDFTAEEGFEKEAAFFVRGWEQLNGQVARPQAAINRAMLADCDYLVLILGERWGSPPSIGGEYTSGTEEEFFETLSLLADADAPMRNILILFRSPSQSALTHPDDQLTKVLEFRDRLERSQQILFNVFDSERALRRYVQGALRSWAADTNEKEAKVVTLPEVVAVGSTGVAGTRSLVALAKEKAAQGHQVQAETLFIAATATADPDALLEYARFVRRAGRLSDAIELNRRILVIPEVAADRTPAAAKVRALALASIGIVERKEGELEKSLIALREAAAELDPHELPDDKAYVADNIAHTLDQLGRSQEGDAQRLLSATYRANDGSPRTLVNRARESLRAGSREAALQDLDEATLSLEGGEDQRLLASALSIKSRALLELGRTEESVHSAQQSLGINKVLGDPDGMAIAHVLLARGLLAAGDSAEAKSHAEAALNLNLKSGNRTGEAICYQVLAEARFSDGDDTEALETLERARSIATDIDNAPILHSIDKTVAHYVGEHGRSD